jgi:hypothetical protein
MTEPILVLAWLILAHLGADFVFQTGSIVRAKAGHGSVALRGVLAHGAIVAICLIPVGLAYAGPGWAFLVVSAVLHMLIDRSKVLLTRRTAAAALIAAHGRHEGVQPSDHLGRAWTPWPAGLFVADQVVHLAVAFVAWAFLLSGAALVPGWVTAVNAVVGAFDPAAVHDVISTIVVIASLAIANVLAAGLFVAILVRPVEQSEGETRWGNRAGPSVVDPPAAPRPEVVDGDRSRRWSVRIGPIDARIEAEPDPAMTEAAAAAEAARDAMPRAQTARVGGTIGILERILIVVFVLTGSEVAIGFVVAAKTLARFRLLDDRDFAEYYLLGTLGSVAVALITSLIGRAALLALLA